MSSSMLPVLRSRGAHTGAPSDFLAGGGEMGSLIQRFDWASHPLGPPHTWPQSLRSALSICLGSRFPILLWWGPDLFMLYNDAYRPMLGTAKHPAALGQRGRECWPEIWDIIGPMLQDTVLRDGQATWSDDQLLVLERSGFPEECYFTFTYSPIRDESGGVGGVFCAVMETTDRVVGVRRLRLLRDVSAETRHALDADDACARAAVALADAPDLPFALIYLFEASGSGRLVARTPSALSLPVPETISRGQQDLLGRVGERALIVPIPGAGEAAPAGLLIAGLNRQRPLDDDYRAFLGLVAGSIASAVTDARALEAERARAEALAQLDRAKTAFFSNVSHEFRTPLTLMLGPTEEALASPDRVLDGEMLETLYRNELRLLKLVNNLLDFATIEAGRAVATFEATDLASLTADLASAFRSAIEAGGLRFDVDCPRLPAPVYVDRSMWEKVVLNLLSNALKFSFNGRIGVSLAAVGDRVELRVSDTGVGISEADLPRLFERFHRIEGVRARTYEGSGIGLALVHDLVRLHHGEIRVESRLNEGTTFIVSIPAGLKHLPADRIAAPSQAAASRLGATPYVAEALRWGRAAPAGLAGAAAARRPEAAATRGAGRVLVVDDNADMRDYLTRLLEPLWSVEVASDGAAALAALAARPADLVLADVMMPGLDGFELVKRIRGRDDTRMIPVVLVSARAGEESRVEGLGAGADDYLVKPFTANELVARVATHLHLGQVRRAVAAERARLYAVFEEAPAAIVVLTGREHRIAFANARYRTLAGGAREALLGRPLPDVLPEIRGSEALRILDRVLETGESVHVPELEILWNRPADGRAAPGQFDWTCQPLRAADGAIEGTVHFLYEVSDRVTARRDLEEARAAAEGASRAKDDFLAMLGHELRNPLAPIVTALQLMTLHGVDSHEKEVIERQVNHLVRLVDDLMDVSRITRGKVELRKTRVKLKVVVGRAIELARPLLEQRYHPLEIRVPDDAVLVADSDRLAQVVSNLLTNAAKYSDPGAPVSVAARVEHGRVLLSVRDEGIGIGADMLEAIFDPFVQQRQALDRASGGLGLGLTIVKNLVALHGGTVRAVSEGLGQGTEFIVDLPLAHGESGPSHRGNESVERLPARGHGSRVLVVDDNRDAAGTLADLLKALDYDVRVAYDAASALQIARELEPQFALLDIGLPQVDGYELGRQIAALAGGRVAPRLIAVTGYGQEADKVRSAAAGFATHIVKPVQLQAVIAALDPGLGSNPPV